MNGGIAWYECHVDSKNLDVLVSMIQKFCRKNGLTEPPPETVLNFLEHVKNVPDGAMCQIKIAENILFGCKFAKADPNIVECSGVVDTVDYKRAIVKIAYELACEWLGPSYLDDPCGEKLRRFILDSTFVPPPIENVINGIVGFVEIPFSKASIDSQACGHAARVCYGDNCLVCQMDIFKVISGAIIVSENPSAYPLFIPKRIELDPIKGTSVEKLLMGVVVR